MYVSVCMHTVICILFYFILTMEFFDHVLYVMFGFDLHFLGMIIIA